MYDDIGGMAADAANRSTGADAQAMMDRIGGELLTWDELRSSGVKQAGPTRSD